MHPGNPSVAVEHDGDGQPGRAEISQQVAVDVYDLGVGDAHVTEEVCRGLRGVFGVNAKERNLLAVPLVGVLQQRHLGTARAAPAGPQID